MKSLSEGVKTYWFAKQGLEGYANPTEPNLYPHAFEAMVKKSEYDKLAQALEKCEGALDFYSNQRGGLWPRKTAEEALAEIQKLKETPDEQE